MIRIANFSKNIKPREVIVKKVKLTCILLFCSQAYASPNQMNVPININSYKDAIAYTKASYFLSESNQCLISDKKKEQYEAMSKLAGASFEVPNTLLLNKVGQLKELPCSVLLSVFDSIIDSQVMIFEKYEIPKETELEILSVDKNTAAHNVMVGNAEKGKWVVCYGLDKSGVPLMKQTSLVKDRYTVVNLRSRKFHDDIVSYECDYQG